MEHDFQFAAEVHPERDKRGRLKQIMPQQSYSEANEKPVHEYGWGPFCKFSIPEKWYGRSGVYIYLVNGEPKYVGEAQNFGERVNEGYGNISPRNCFRGGQRTNCRINHKVFESVQAGKTVELYFRSTDVRKRLEDKLVEGLNPPWNRETLETEEKKKTGASTEDREDRPISENTSR